MMDDFRIDSIEGINRIIIEDFVRFAGLENGVDNSVYPLENDILYNPTDRLGLLISKN